MKISKDTINIIKNFAQLNSNLILKPGNKIATVTANKTVIAEAVVSETFPSEFGIYDLNQFLGALTLFDDPDLSFTDTHVVISQGNNSLRYFAASTAVLTAVPNLKTFPTPDIEFDLPAAVMNQIHRAAAVLGVEDLALIGDNAQIIASVGDKKNPTSNSFASAVGVTDKSFHVNIKMHNLRVLANDYHVAIANKKIARMQAQTQQLTYYIAVEQDSVYNF